MRVPGSGLRVDRRGCEVDDLVYCGAVQVRVAADLSWSDVVSRAVAEEWTGIEALAGVPGTVADVTRDNAGAHGQTVGGVVASVRTWDRLDDAQRTFAAADCGFDDGASRFSERLPDGSYRLEVLEVSLLLATGDLTSPIRDEGLAGLLEVEVGQRVALADVAEAVRPARVNELQDLEAPAGSPPLS